MHGGKIAYDALPFRKHFPASAFSRSVMSELSSATTPQVSLKHLKHLKHWTLGFGCFSIRQCGASIIRESHAAGLTKSWHIKIHLLWGRVCQLCLVLDRKPSHEPPTICQSRNPLTRYQMLHRAVTRYRSYSSLRVQRFASGKNCDTFIASHAKKSHSQLGLRILKPPGPDATLARAAASDMR
jgi:hypothetical protein